MRAFAAAVVFGAMLGLAACGDGDEGDDEGSGGTTSAGGTNGESGATGSDSRCSRGCVDTLAADCDNGPTSQSECEQDCEALEAGACGDEYRAFQDCADGETITCSAAGLPSVAACGVEQQAFVGCLN